jgi:hypothetical protein
MTETQTDFRTHLDAGIGALLVQYGVDSVSFLWAGTGFDDPAAGVPVYLSAPPADDHDHQALTTAIGRWVRETVRESFPALQGQGFRYDLDVASDTGSLVFDDETDDGVAPDDDPLPGSVSEPVNVPEAVAEAPGSATAPEDAHASGT